MKSAPVYLHRRTSAIERQRICERIARAGYARPKLRGCGRASVEVAQLAEVEIVDINDYRKWWAV